MRLLSISGGVILAAIISLVGGALLQPNNTFQENLTASKQRNEVPRIVLQAMSWWYFSAQISLAEYYEHSATYSVVIDLRQPEDFALGHLPGAVNVPAEQLIVQLGSVAPDHDRNILLYGYDETHSVRSLATLRLLAYSHVVHLKGGWANQYAVPNVSVNSRKHSALIS
ncbi:MAG: rhodanese-like domain-containing protein [Gammaproteobacteria bacterium]|nr:rhodanese-like domain-containing protein [Gammaproteobacteria bacterium]